MPERAVSSELNWQMVLKDLRQVLPREREAGGVRGSLRWLEDQMRLRGASPSVVRNIVYRNVGTQADKETLYRLLSDLAQEAGLALPALQQPSTVIPEELDLLGRNKRRAFKQFLRTVQSGKVARMLLTGTKGVGKTLLIEHLEREIQLLPHPPIVTRLTLEGDLTRIFGLFELHASQPFGVQAEQQRHAARHYLEALSGVLLVRVGRQADFAGLALRQADGVVVTPTRWAAQQLYQQAPPALSVLLASEDEASLEGLRLAQGEHIHLTSPSRAEARHFLMARLNISAQQADTLVQQTGRNLDRLTLLAIARGQGQADFSRLLQDPEAVELLCALRACALLQAQPAAAGSERLAGGPHSRQALEAALGHSLDRLSPYVRALLDEINGQWPRPVSALLLGEAPELPPAQIQAALERLLKLASQANHPLGRVQLDLLALLERWEELALRGQEQLAEVAALWPQARRGAVGEVREELARLVVTFYAIRGEYDEPQARDALFTLLDAQRGAVRAWGRVKLAESCVDTGNFETAEQHLLWPEIQHLLAQSASDDWERWVQADALLVAAALARWRGHLAQATELVSDPRTQHSGSRATLWRGLIAKDAGDWLQATRYLQQVPEQYPLLFARARYQEGDLRLRLGQPAAALSLLEAAASQLEKGAGSQEERARVTGRLLTAQRRLGNLEAAAGYQQQLRNVTQATDPVLGARLASEGLPLSLALSHPREAFEAAQEALQLLETPSTRQAEASYRRRRSIYRLALCYLTRGTGQAYRQPFLGVGALSNAELGTPENADVQQAQRLLDELLAAGTGELDRDRMLYFDILLSRALAEPQPLQALALAQRALELADQPATEAQAYALRAEALVRAQQPEEALRDINRAYTLWRRSGYSLGDSQQPDPGLHALLLTLEALCNLQLAEPRSLVWLSAGLQDHTLRHFRAQCWQVMGQILERCPAQAQNLPLPSWAAFMRLGDALSLLYGTPQETP